MKLLNILFLTLFYFFTYISISYFLDIYFSLETDLTAILVIGLIFSILLIVLLSFDIPEKIAEKIFYSKEENVVEEYFENEVVQPEKLVQIPEKEESVEGVY